MQHCLQALDDSRRGLRVAIALHRTSQTYSMGLKSGYLAGQSIRRISSVSRKSSTRLALCDQALSSIKMKSGATAPLKSEYRASRSHLFASQKSGCLFQKHGGLCGYPTRCLPRPPKHLCRIGQYIGHWRNGSGSPVLFIWKYGENQLLGWTGTHHRLSIDPCYNLYNLCTILSGLSSLQKWPGTNSRSSYSYKQACLVKPSENSNICNLASCGRIDVTIEI